MLQYIGKTPIMLPDGKKPDTSDMPTWMLVVVIGLQVAAISFAAVVIYLSW